MYMLWGLLPRHENFGVSGSEGMVSDYHGTAVAANHTLMSPCGS
jgi:hypothetical protein